MLYENERTYKKWRSLFYLAVKTESLCGENLKNITELIDFNFGHKFNISVRTLIQLYTMTLLLISSVSVSFASHTSDHLTVAGTRAHCPQSDTENVE